MEYVDLTKPYAPHDENDELFVFADHSAAASEKIVAPRYSYWKSVGRVFFRKKSNWVALIFMGIIILLAIFYPIFQPYGESAALNPNIRDVSTFSLSPSDAIGKLGFHIKWIFGTSPTGNSIFNALWSATRTSVSLAFICTIINMIIGVVLGAVWGLSKRFDVVMTQIYNIIANVPYVLLISVLVYIIGAGYWAFVFALTITGWLGIAYFIRTQVIIIRDREYNLASKTLGTRTGRIVTRNILPFMVSVIVTLIASELPSYIGYEVFLSYIGVGLSASNISIGRMISESEPSWVAFPWQFWPPVAISAVVSIVLYVVGQNIGDASDPRTHM